MIAAIAMIARAGEGLAPVAVAASADGHRVYVAEYAAGQVVEFDPVAKQVLRSVAVASPYAMALSGEKLFVTEAVPAGRVHVIDTATMGESATVNVGHEPSAVALNKDGSRLAVANRFDNNVAIIDTKSLKEIAKVAVVREPVSLVWSADGSKLFVGNHLPSGAANGGFIASVISVIDVAKACVATNIALPNGSTAVRSICISPDGRYVYATHLLGHYQLPTTQLERGWMYVNTLTIIDAQASAYVNTVLLDDVDLGAANPWGAACSPDGAFICVAHAGTHEVSIIDRAALHDRLARAEKSERITEVTKSSADVPTDLSFVYTIRRRAALAGNGPRGIAIGGGNVFAAEYFTDSIGVASLTNDAKAVSLALGAPQKMSAARRGEMVFDDASHCFQHWQSCSSCHPDTRVDGLNWDNLNDGIGNPKNTKNMLLLHETPPMMSLGVRENVDLAIVAGFKFIQFSVVSDEDAKAVEAYLQTLKPAQSPHLVSGWFGRPQLSAAAKRGKSLFASAGCADCHPAPLFTNNSSYDLGTTSGMDGGKPVDTPTLVECWRTAPYLHDGSAATLRDVLTRCNPKDRHGQTSKLKPEEINDLVEYISSL